MAEKKEIKCQVCNETFNETDLIIRTKTTDRFIRMGRGIPSWEEDEYGLCPNCMRPLMKNNKKIEYQKV